MRDINEVAFLFLIALTWAIYSIPVGSKRVWGLIGLITSSCGAAILYFQPIVYAPISGTAALILKLLFVAITMVLALRTAWGRREPAGAAKAAERRS